MRTLRGSDALLVLATLLLPPLLLFYDLPAFGLLNNGEGIYAEIAREMLTGGDWIVPHLDGLPYVEKPPLLYWLLALSMKLFGVGDLSVRLVPTLAAVFVCALVGGFGARLAGWRHGAMAALMLGSSAGLLLMGRIALADGLLTAFLSAACLLTYLALHEARRLWWRLALISLALAVLAKGLVALMLFNLIGITHLAINDRRRWRQHLHLITDPWAWGLFLLLAMPWHWAASVAQPQFTWSYFINEHLLRFFGQREPHDYYSGSVIYHLPRLALLALPWLPPGALAAWTQRGEETPRDGAQRFLWVCVLVPLVFFSLSSAKANYYTVICLPPLVLLMAGPLARWWRQDGQWRSMALTAHGNQFSATTHAIRKGQKDPPPPGLPLSGGGDDMSSLRSQSPSTSVLRSFTLLLPVLLMALTEFALLKQAAQRETHFSARAMAHTIRQGEDLPVFIYQDFEDYSALPFYLQRPVGSIDCRSEDLQFGLRLAQPSERFPSLKEFLGRSQPSYVVILDSRQHHPLPPELSAGLEQQVRIGNATLYRHPGAAQP